VNIRGNKWLVMLVVTIPSITIEMAGTSVFVAFETIASDLGVDIERSVWLTTMYLATNAMMLPIAGWLRSKLGYKRTILLSMGIFTISALLGGLAQNFESLVIFRALQGMGDGPILPIATALLLEIFPEKERGRMMAINMFIFSVAPALAPLIASQVVQAVGWRGIFYMNVLLGLLSLTLVAALLPSAKEKGDKVKLNWPMFLLLAIGTGSMQLFLDRGQHYDWFASRSILILFIVAAVALVVFLTVTIKFKDGSVLELKILKDITFLAGNIANVLLTSVLFSTLLLKILYLQWLMGYTPGFVAYYQSVLVGVMLLFSLIAGYMTDKVHPRWSVILGLPIAFYGLLLSSRLTLHNDLHSIMQIGAILGAGAAFIFVPISVTVFATISKIKLTAASVLNSYLGVMSQGIAMALAVTLLMRRMDVNAVRLAESVQIDNPAVVQLTHKVGHDSGLAMIYENIMLQATMVSFNDVFYVLAITLFLLLLYLPFMKRAG